MLYYIILLGGDILNYTVSDFYETFKNGFTVVAGAGGMARTIVDAGLLDYEMDASLKDKYFHSNFHENGRGVDLIL